MKKIFLKTVLTIFIALFALTSFNTFAGAKEMKLIFATFEPEPGPWAQLMKVVAKDIGTATSGQVTVTCSFGGALGGPGEFYDLVKKRIVDMALSVPAFGNPGQFPILDTIALPYIIPTAEIGSQAMTMFYDKGYLDQEFKDVKPLWFQTGQGVTLFTRDHPVRTLDDVKGLKIFAATPLEQEKVKLWGGTPVAVPMTDLYMALNKKIIDGILFNYNGMVLFKLNEELNFNTQPGSGCVSSCIIVNKDVYKNLPPEAKKFLEENKMKYAKMFGQGWDKLCTMGKDLFLKTGGQEVHWDPKSMEKRNQLESPMWDKFIADTEKKGFPGRQAVNGLYNILKDLGVDPTAIGYTPAK